MAASTDAVGDQCVGDGFAQRFGRPIGPPSYEANAGRITTKNREMIVTTHHTPLPIRQWTWETTRTISTANGGRSTAAALPPRWANRHQRFFGNGRSRGQWGR